jgi:uncharacterized protein (DUF433 family)
MVDHMAFTRRNASELTGLSERRLRDWQRAGVLVPRYGDRPIAPDAPPSHFYSFRDLIGLRALATLRERGVPLQELRQVQPWLLRHQDIPWEQLDLPIDGKRLILDQEVSGGDREGASDRLELGPLAADLRAAITRLRQRRPEQIGQVTRYRGVQGGAWVLAGTRIPTWSVMQMHEEGYDLGAILRQFPDLTEADVEAAIAHDASLRRKGAA